MKGDDRQRINAVPQSGRNKGIINQNKRKNMSERMNFKGVKDVYIEKHRTGKGGLNQTHSLKGNRFQP